MTSGNSNCSNNHHQMMEFRYTLSKKTRSNQNIQDLKIEEEPAVATTNNNAPQIANKRHSLSSLLFRGKQPQSRVELGAPLSEKMKIETTEKKGYFERRRERKLKKIEQKPVYKWNYKSLYKWLKYKGFEKKYIRQLKKDRLNGYIMLTLEISDLVTLDIPSDVAKCILDTLVEVSEKQDNVVDATCECGEVELPLQPVRSTMIFAND